VRLARVLGFVLASLVGLLPASLSAERSASSIVLGQRASGLVFAHRLHTMRPCLDCHPKAETSRSAAEQLAPSSRACEACHTVRHDALPKRSATGDPACEVCHGTRARPAEALPGHLAFSHAAHQSLGCSRCHGEATAVKRPKMATCLGCHPVNVSGAGGNRCTLCHESAQGRVRTRFSEGMLVPKWALPGLAHDSLFRSSHGQVAGNEPRLCQMCHGPRDCSDCHDGRLRPRAIHPGDWLRAHKVAARLDANRCASCHRDQSNCATCHQRVGMTSSGPTASLGGRGRVHGARSVFIEPPVTSRHHGAEARRNLRSCTSCHRESDCIRCHASPSRGGVGSYGGARLMPHPPGFAGRCRKIFAKNSRSCLACHRPTDQSLSRCR